MNEIIRLQITQDDVDKYNRYYFLKHPKAKKKRILRPIHPSINQWSTVDSRITMNLLKQSWKEFSMFYCKAHKLCDMHLDDYAMEFVSYMPTRRRADPDNYVPKFILDGFVESGFLVDDDGAHMRALILRTGYDANNPRTEINVRIFKED